MKYYYNKLLRNVLIRISLEWLQLIHPVKERPFFCLTKITPEFVTCRMGKRKPVTAKKAWVKLDTTDIEVIYFAVNIRFFKQASYALLQKANISGSRALLRDADPEHKGNEELFFTDKKGVGALRPGRREPWALKSTAILKANPKIPVIPNNSSHKKIRSPNADKIRAVVEQIKEDSGSNAASQLKPKKPPSIAERSFDLWADEAPVAPAAALDSSKLAWLSGQNVNPTDFQGRALGNSNRSRKILSAMKPEPSIYAPVEVPHPGPMLSALHRTPRSLSLSAFAALPSTAPHPGPGRTPSGARLTPPPPRSDRRGGVPAGGGGPPGAHGPGERRRFAATRGTVTTIATARTYCCRGP